MKRNLLLVLIFSFLPSISHAAPIYNPETEHWYERISKEISWVDAKEEASALINNGATGHLATITSSQENWWIVNNLGGALTLDCWLGGYLEGGKWKWVTGETWTYQNWWSSPGSQEPSGDGNALQFDDDERTPPLPGYWNDLDRNNPESGYIVEYETRPVPVPAAIWLFGTGVLGLKLLRRFKALALKSE